ncbi:CDP-2,3-bis-(O-geranylgeranyl)-sn-glycerol synthase [Microvirga flocculans]|uniref:CDP-2,3-bis-(O-geranylgeranyl)-sn-glycerol synthase n=1 Tax=Microvirga flocculans TaxID=217168 RepID=A0A7W6N8E3_9HYPH|nr:CDP-archaeol synthase [Microvirga flocculans]MBB4040338.1 CDP-2,3-bis-(O-geranylgeranyl)-sn-glycerol synthase [Microvirga flocculans]
MDDWTPSVRVEASNVDEFRLNLTVLFLLGAANGTPIFIKKLLKDRLAKPLDFGLKLPDGQPLLGSSKTFRGLAASIAATALCAEALGIGYKMGAWIATLSMLGDLCASFLKRRLRLRPHARAFGIDQIPEALLPLVLLRKELGLDTLNILVLTTVFILLEIWLSRLLFKLRIRDRPY